MTSTTTAAAARQSARTWRWPGDNEAEKCRVEEGQPGVATLFHASDRAPDGIGASAEHDRDEIGQGPCDDLDGEAEHEDREHHGIDRVGDGIPRVGPELGPGKDADTHDEPRAARKNRAGPKSRGLLARAWRARGLAAWRRTRRKATAPTAATTCQSRSAPSADAVTATRREGSAVNVSVSLPRPWECAAWWATGSPTCRSR